MNYTLRITHYALRFLFVLCSLVLSSQSHAAGVRAFVDRTNVPLGESLRLTVSISEAGGDVDVSPIKDFKVIPRGTGTNYQMANGKTSWEISYNYALIPLKEGRLVIPELKVDSDGKVYKTEPIAIQVLKRDAKNVGNREVFAEAQVSDANPYEGQQIIYTFKFYHAVQIARGASFQKPDFSGFAAEALEQEKNYKAVVAGQGYDVTELRYVLVPLNPGQRIIGPAALECKIARSRGKRRSGSLFDSVFDDPFFGNAHYERKVLRTEPLTVEVRPLPAYDGDVKFSGLVGKFDIRAQIEAGKKIKVGDSTTLSLVVSGEGNLMDAEAPEIKVPDGFKTYEDTPEEKIQLAETGYRGQKVFRIALVPIRDGDYALEPARLSYFDVSQGKYRTLSAKPFSLSVAPAEKKDELAVFSAPSTDAKPLGEKVEFTGRDILPLKEELDALESMSFLSPFRFTLFLLMPALFWVMIRVGLVFTQKSDDPAAIMAERAEKSLKDACSVESSGEEFLTCLYRSLVSAIYSKAGTKGESLTYAEAREILREKGYSQETAEKAAKLLEKIESAKFGGQGADRAFGETLLSQVKEMIRSLS